MCINLKIVRIRAGIKQKDLANATGVSQQCLSKLENGKTKNPNRELMLKLAEALETDVQTLFFSETN